MPATEDTDKEQADPHPHAKPGSQRPPGPVAGDTVLVAERAHLSASRACLRRMREDVLSLRALAGDRVSEEYLKADLYRRADGQVLHRAVWSHLAAPAAVVLPRGARRWRVPAHEIADLVAGLRQRGVRYGAGRDLLGHRIAHVMLTRMEEAGEPCDDRTHDAVRRSRPVKAVIGADDHVPVLSTWLARAGIRHVLLGADTELPDETAAAGEPGARLVLVPVTLAKGLEFDQVIVVEPARITGGEQAGLRRLYVALTRAVSRLCVLHAKPLPQPLR